MNDSSREELLRMSLENEYLSEKGSDIIRINWMTLLDWSEVVYSIAKKNNERIIDGLIDLNNFDTRIQNLPMDYKVDIMNELVNLKKAIWIDKRKKVLRFT